MRALTSLSTILALGLGLTACGDNGSTTDVTTNAPTTDEPGTTGGTTTNTPTTEVGTTTDNPTTDVGTSTGNLTGLTTSGSTTDEPTVGTTSDPSEGTTTDSSVGTTGGASSTTTDTGDSTGSGDTTTGGAADPNWPAPDPMNAMMPCGADFAAASFSMGGLVCSPTCGANDVCPEALTGDAQGACVFNPTSSGDTCKMGDKCMTMGEECVQTGGGGMACLAPSDHCVLLCNGGETCPDGMECFDDLVCQYPI